MPPSSSSASVRPPSPSRNDSSLSSPLVSSSSPSTPPLSSSPSSSEYLSYLSSLHSAWSDCPLLSVTYRDLAVRVCDASSKADASAALARAVRRSNSSRSLTIDGTLQPPTFAEEHIPTTGSATIDIIKSPWTMAKKVAAWASSDRDDDDDARKVDGGLQVLAACEGTIRPGTMTIILSPPGGGKSALLRALSGRIDASSGLSGTILYNGLTIDECKARGIHVTRLAAYVGQSDASFPVLTVEESLQFSSDTCAADIKLLRAAGDSDSNAELESLDARRVPLMMSMLGLSECAGTIMGNDMLRGVSGGQKKRTMTGESLLANARLYALDEFTNGLDSAVSLSILSSLKSACAIGHSSVVAALQQVTPECYALFDDVILMREGRVVFHGPRESIPTWLSEVAGIPHIPASIEEAGFLIDILSDPRVAMEKAALAHRVASDKAIVKAASSAPNPFVKSELELAGFTSIDALVARSGLSSASLARSAAVDSLLSASARTQSSKCMLVATWSCYTQSQYGRAFPHSRAYHTALCCKRELKLMSRNKAMIIPRLFSAVFMGFVYGTLFYQLETSDFASRLGLIQNAVLFVSFMNFQELPVAAECKQVVVRQIDSGFFPSISYTVAVNLLTTPLLLAEVIIFGILVYFIPGFVIDGGRFLFFEFILFTVSSATSQLFRTVTYAARNADLAQQLNLPFVLLFVVFSGFLIPRPSIAPWLLWALYMSPFSWAIDTLAINEFESPSYSGPDPSGQFDTIGLSYMNSFGFNTSETWKWAAVAYLWGFYFVLTTLSTIVLAYMRPIVTMGSKRSPMTSSTIAAKSIAVLPSLVSNDHVIAISPSKSMKVPLLGKSDSSVGGYSSSSESAAPLNRQRSGAPSLTRQLSFQFSALPFAPCAISWRDIKYTVHVGPEKTPKVLLKGISGYAQPGQLLALMGASGAGKTTLLDVIAGRKTVGIIESECNIFINGRPKTEVSNFDHLTAYAEQFDIHNGQATCREALEFSARLRLPASVSDASRSQFVDEVMDLVGLTMMQNRQIGDVALPSLSAGQLKLITIAVELVANPPILFLDEPTSGLDSKSAYRVMKAIKRIAATQRTVICTIHQPSQEVFLMFDRLLLLKAGGETVYFDDIGDAGSKLVSYLSRVSDDRMPYSELVNPSSWMLDVIGTDATKDDEQTESNVGASDDEPSHDQYAAQESRSRLSFASAWSSSPESGAAQVVIDRLSSPSAYTSASATSVLAASDGDAHVYVSTSVRLRYVVYRSFVSHWRLPALNVTRPIIMFVIGIFLGIVYYKIDSTSYAGMNSLIAAIFLGISLPASVCAIGSLATFFRGRAIYARESSVKMYDYRIYALSMTLVELPYLLHGTIAFLIPFYFMVGFSNTPALFAQYTIVTYIMVLFFSFFHQIFIAALPNLVAAQALNGLLMSVTFAFGGLYIKAAAIPIGWKWLYYATPVGRAFVATALTQIQCASGVTNYHPTALIDGCAAIEIPGIAEPVQLYEYVSAQLQGNTGQYGIMIGWLGLTLVVLKLASTRMFSKINHIER